MLAVVIMALASYRPNIKIDTVKIVRYTLAQLSEGKDQG